MTKEIEQGAEAPKKATPQKKYQGALMARLEEDEAEIKALEDERAGVEPEKPDDIGDLDHETNEPLPEPTNVEEVTFKKRYADLRRYNQRKVDELNEKNKELEDKLAKASQNMGEMPSTPEEIEAWMKEFPDAARVIKTLVAKESDAGVKELEARLKELEQREIDASVKSAEAYVLVAHPDYEQLKTDPEFHAWVKTRSAKTQAQVYDSYDPNDVIEVIDDYKAHNPVAKTDPKEKKTVKNDAAEAAAAVTTKPNTSEPSNDPKGKKFRESEIAKMTSKDYEKLADEIDQAIAEGNFIYDVSGAATAA